MALAVRLRGSVSLPVMADAAATLAKMSAQNKFDMIHGWVGDYVGDVPVIGPLSDGSFIPALHLHDGDAEHPARALPANDFVELFERRAAASPAAPALRWPCRGCWATWRPA